MTELDIEFYTDFICPWCYIGKERINKVIHQLQDESTIRICPKPHILYPHIPVGGIDKSVFAKTAKPGMGRSLRDEAQIEHLTLNYNAIRSIPNSRKAHLLIALIERHQDQWTASLEIIRAYFENGQNIEDCDYLYSVGQSKGLDMEQMKNTLEDPSFNVTLDQEIKNARAHHISSVPTIRLNKKVIIPGLQSAEVWTKYLRRAAVMNM